MKGMSSLSMSAQRRRLRGTMMASLPAAGLCFSGKVTKGLVCPGSGRTRSFGRERFGPCPRGQEIADFPNGDGGFWLPSRDSNPDHRLQRPVCYHYTTRQLQTYLEGMVPKAGLEPARAKRPTVFETVASANSATSARSRPYPRRAGGVKVGGRARVGHRCPVGGLGIPSGDPGAYGRRSLRVT